MTGTRLVGRFALGAALGVALTIAATQAWNASAAPGDADTTFVPTTPCRLVDMRPGTLPASGKKTPLGPGVANIFTQQVTGNVGSCVGIPSDAKAVALNVTVANMTASSFLTVYPADKPLPNASNLNWVAGQAPTPNKVDVKLSPDGKINLFNESGTVNVIADVVGYYTSSSLTQLSARLAQLEARQPVVAKAEDSVEKEVPLGSLSGSQLSAVEGLSVTINAPAAGFVTVVADATARDLSGAPNIDSRLVCQVTNNPAATSVDISQVLGIASPVVSQGVSQPSLGTNRVFPVVAGANTFRLMCAATGNSANEIHYRSMTATYIANG